MRLQSKLELQFALGGVALCLLVCAPLLINPIDGFQYHIGILLGLALLILTTVILAKLALRIPIFRSKFRCIVFGIGAALTCLTVATIGFGVGNTLSEWTALHYPNHFWWLAELKIFLLTPIAFMAFLGPIPCAVLGSFYGLSKFRLLQQTNAG